jgi:hypothetical protein
VTQAQKLILPKTREVWTGQGGINGGLYEPRGAEARFLIVSIGTIREGIAWGEYGKRIAGADDEFDGRVNTKAILAADTDNALVTFATGLVIDGHQDFYTPAIGELRHLYNTVGDLIRDALDDTDVWSSTQSSADSAWYQNFGHGYTSYWSKVYTAGALAVRSISASVFQ